MQEPVTADQAARLDALSPERRALLARLLQQRANGKGCPQHVVPGRPDGGAGLPPIVPRPAQRYQPFPLNELQQAYWIGRSGAFQMGNVASHCYLELEGEFDVERLSQALRRVIARHDMLRAVILPDGQQQILESVPPYRIEVDDLRAAGPAARAAALEATRERMSHQVLPSDRWPLFEVRASRLDERGVRLHVSLDALILDGWSISLLFKEWATVYHAPHTELPPLELSFRDYVLAERATADAQARRRAEAYWRRRVADLPPAPELPLARIPETLRDPRFVRRTARLEPSMWGRLKGRATQAGLTSTGILLAAYAEVLTLWSATPRFTLNVPRFNRFPAHPQVTEILGEFASFSLLDVDNSAQGSFEARARRHQQRLWEDLDYSAYGGVGVLRDLARAQNRSTGVLMPVVFTSAPRAAGGLDVYPTVAAGELGSVVYAINQTSQVWLDNHVYEHDGALVCDWDTVEALFPPGLSQAMFEAFFELLHVLATEEAAWQEDRGTLARRLLPAEQRRQREAANATAAPVPDGLLQERFAAQVAQRPAHAAVVTSSRTLTYDGLYRLSNRWGRHLRALGARPNTLVAVVMEKGWEQPVAVLGTLQAGAAYLPVDAGLPKERLWYLLQHGQVELVLTQSWLEQRLDWPPGVTRLCVDREPPAEVDDGPLTAVQQPDDLACCIFTSGSTGLPKGVMITHRGVLNAILDTNRAFDVGPADRVLALTALHHDMSFYDLFGMLAAGGTLVIPDAAGRRDPAHWSELMRRERVTLWNSVPAMMDMLLEYAAGRQEQGPAQSAVLPECLRLAFLGGDWIPRSIPHRLGTQVPAARVVSVGGPTETTLWNIWYPVEAVDPQWKSIPYGRPIANSRYYVLNDAMADCPDWVPGELYCAGTGLARGYWRDEARTQAKFVVHPATGERLCRTGDLGRYQPDGTIEFVGRADFQVKIQGQRIELGEIEATLQRHHAVGTAVVMAVGEAQGKKRLVAYVVPREGAAAAPEELRPFLLGQLAEHMVPSAFVILDRLPLSGNGKVDRLALAKLAPRDAAGASASGAAAGADAAGGTPSVVERIGRIVAEVLELDRPDPAANLLSLGASSLDMVRIGNRLEAEFGARPRLDEIFRLQTVAALAGYYDRRGQAASPGDAQGQVAGRATPATEFLKPLNGTVNGLLHGAGAGPAGPMGVEALLAGYRVLLGPAEREAWKKSQPGIRRDDPGRPGVQLPRPVVDEALRRQYTERRSQRQFSPRPIPFESFGTFLSCLMQLTLEQGPKYRYASPGGLYPTQVYLHVKPGRVEGVPAGTYYYHPVEHRLVSLHPGAQLDRSIHVPFINTPIFDQAAFSVFLVAELAAIAPSYGEQSIRFATLEAGIMAHLLETAAPRAGLGLCQVGSVEFERIRQYFDLRQSHVLIHSLLGGLAPSAEEQGAAAGGAGAPLSFSQRRLWFTDQLAAGRARRSPNSNPNAWRIDGPLVVEALERSFDAVRRRHEILRTTVTIEGGEPVQVVAPPSPFELPVVDLRHLPPEVREAEVRRLTEAEAQHTFDLAAGPLLRATLVRLEDEAYVLLLNSHYFVADGMSEGILLRELETLYAAYARGATPALPPLPMQYGDFARWQRDCLQGELRERQLTYWKAQLRGCPAQLKQPTDRPRGAHPTFSGTTQAVALPGSLSAAIRALGRREGVTRFMVFLAAWQLVLQRHTGQDDVVVGTTVSNRGRPEAERLVGFFSNNLLLRTDLSGNPTFRELLRRVGETAIGAYSHQDLPYEELARELLLDPQLGAVPAVQTVLVLHEPAAAATLALPGLGLRHLPVEKGTATFELAVRLVDSEDDGAPFTGSVEYNTDLFDASTIERLMGDFCLVLERLVADCDQPIGAVPLPDPPLAVPSSEFTVPRSPFGVDRQLGTRNPEPGTRNVVGPRDDLERRLAEVWSAVLGIHPLGIAESFFELGGTSLRAVQLFARIKDVFGVDLPLETLFKAPTVMECAALLAQAMGLSRDLSVPGAPSVGGAWSPLVAIRAGGALAPVEPRGPRSGRASGASDPRRGAAAQPATGEGVRGGVHPPFFCVHGAGGHVLNFYDLAHRLGPDQPFYGLQARGVDGTLVPLARIEEMASLYLEEIRRVQPAGPYYLGGYSGGGVIAFEMAQQLRRAGQETALLVLIDSASPRLPTRRALSANWRGLCRLGPGYGRHLPRKALEGVLRHLRRLQIEHYRRRGQPLPHTLRDLAIWDATLQALRTYTPQPYAGAAVLFRSAVIDPAYGHHEADLGWTELVRGGLTLEIVPGDHQSLMAEPNAAVLADALCARLRAALR